MRTAKKNSPFGMKSESEQAVRRAKKYWMKRGKKNQMENEKEKKRKG